MDKTADHQTVASLRKFIGRSRMAVAVGVSVSAVDLAVHHNAMPASWYRAISALCQSAGINCPMDLFNWKAPAPEGERKPEAAE